MATAPVRPFAHVALPLSTPRLALRALTLDDLAAYGAWHADPEIQRWLERRQHPLRGATLRPRLGREAAETAERRQLVLGVVDATDGRLVGRCRAFAPAWSVPPRGVRVEVTVGIVADARRQGVARECLAALITAIRRPTETLQLQGWIDRENAPARALAACFPGFVPDVSARDGTRVTDCLEWIIPREPSRRRRAVPAR